MWTRLLIALCALAALAGCGEEDAEEAGRALKVNHGTGETYVPARAKRVVALSPDALDTAIALGVRPVGMATPADGRPPDWLPERFHDIPTVGPSHRLDLDRIRRLKPDLILGARQRHGSLHGELSEIAAFVTSERSGRNWLINTRLFGEALGRTNQVERLLRGWDHSVARTRRRLAGAEGTEVSVVQVLPDRLRVAGDGSFAAPILDQVRLARTRLGLAKRKFTNLRPDRAGAASAELVLASRGSPPAGVRGRVVRVSDDVWWLDGGILAGRAALRELERALAPAR